MADKKWFLYFSNVWPRLKSSAASERVFGIIRLFNKHLYETDFVCSGKKPGSNIDGINQFSFAHGITIDPNNHEAIVSHLKKFNRLWSDFVIFDGFVAEEFYSHHVHKWIPNAVWILDT